MSKEGSSRENYAVGFPQDKFPLTIESLAFGGDGLGRHNGKVVFVPGAIPGDRVLVALTRDRKDHAFGKLLSFIEQSPNRLPSPCVYDDQCGGCHWLCLPYNLQKTQKTKFVGDSLQRMNAGPLPPIQFVEASQTQHYRSRILLRGTILSGGKISVGFFAKGSHDQVPIETCLNASESINGLIRFLSDRNVDAPSQKFRMEIQELPALQLAKQACLLVILYPLHGSHSLGPLKQLVASYDKTVWVGFSNEVNEVADKPFLFEQDLGLDFYTFPGVFQQIHVELNRKVRRLVKGFAEEKQANTILDLFCGSGNLSLPLATKTRDIFGCEQAKSSVFLAQWNAKKNGLSNVKFSAECSESYLMKKIGEHLKIDLLIADPPRKGMKECLGHILALRPKHIAYLSCDPMTLARDVKTLVPEYVVEKIFAFDFFPNTYHVETLVLLTRTLTPN